MVSMTTGGSFGFVTVDMVARVEEGNRDESIPDLQLWPSYQVAEYLFAPKTIIIL